MTTLKNPIFLSFNVYSGLIIITKVILCSLLGFVEIRNFYFNQNKTKSRKDMRAGNSKSLWNSVKTAKDINVEPIPKKLFLGGMPVVDRIAELSS